MKKVFLTTVFVLASLFSNMALAAKPASGQKAVRQKSGDAAKQKTTYEISVSESKTPAMTFLMAETKAYELFRSGNYDGAAPYFAHMANEKSATMIDAMKFDGVDVVVMQYVDAHLLKFLVKGEFEKTSDYVERINEANRNKKIQALANTIFEELKQQEKKAINMQNFKLSRYYADEEAFQINSSYGIYIVNVDLASARSFKSNFSKMQIKDLDFTPDSGRLKLSYFTLVNPDNNKSYPFISGLPTTYNAAKIEMIYTARLGAGTPMATRVLMDTLRVMRSIKPLAPSAVNAQPKQQQTGSSSSEGGNRSAGLSNAATPTARVTEKDAEIVLEN